jgi:hypothetical protein
LDGASLACLEINAAEYPELDLKSVESPVQWPHHDGHWRGRAQKRRVAQPATAASSTSPIPGSGMSPRGGGSGDAGGDGNGSGEPRSEAG